MNPEVVQVPDEFLCPILQTILEDPVMTIDGHTFERKAITEWLERGNNTNPLTNKKLQSFVLIPNLALKSAIEKFKAKLPPEMKNKVINPAIVKPMKPLSPIRKISPVRRFSPLRSVSPEIIRKNKTNYLIRSKDKKTLNLVLIGHVDCGKSTLLGHLLYKWGGNRKITLDHMKSIESLAFDMGKGSFKFAWLVDQSQNQRQRGITINSSLREIESNKFMCNFIDTPGIRDFEKERTKYMNSADAGLLVVAACPGQFQAGISKMGQTRSIPLIAFTVGIKQLVVVVNKMDGKYVDYSESRFRQIKKEVGDFLTKVGYWVGNIKFVPISAWHGENLIEKTEKMPWYKGPTLLEAIDELTAPRRPVEKPLRICVNEVYHKKGVITGIVKTGQVNEGDKIVANPGNYNGTVKSLESFSSPLKEAECGDLVGIKLTEAQIPKEILSGCMIGSRRNDPPREVQTIIAQIIVMNVSNQFNRRYEPTMYCHTARVPVRVTQITEKIDRRTWKEMEKQPKYLRMGECGMIEMITLKPVCIEKFSEYPALGRFYLHDNGATVAVGVVKNVVYKQQTKTPTK